MSSGPIGHSPRVQPPVRATRVKEPCKTDVIPMSEAPGTAWRARIALMQPEHRARLLGCALSERFSGLPLTVSMPPFVAALYGSIIGSVLIMPLGVLHSWDLMPWLSDWVMLLVSLILLLSLLGLGSMALVAVSRRAPSTVPRRLLYAMPFLGLIWVTLAWSGLLGEGWGRNGLGGLLLMFLPGPLWVHLTWAPRWRLLRRLEGGLDPFSDSELLPISPRTDPDEAAVIAALALEQVEVDLDEVEV